VTFVPYHLTESSHGQHLHKIEHGAVSGTSGISAPKHHPKHPDDNGTGTDGPEPGLNL
jgi:hypothetical protein